MTLVFVFFLDDVDGALFGLEVGLGKVLAEDADTHELDAADEHDHADRRGPSRDRVTECERAHRDHDDEQEREQAEQQPRDGRDHEGRGGERDNPVERVREQFQEVPFRAAGDPVDVLVGDPFGAEADPSVDALGEPVDLLHGQDRVDHGP